jgi:hypothetical protein
MLKITRPNEKVECRQIKMLIYGTPGCGKTSLSFTADAPLLLDFDKGSHRAVNRKDIIQIDKWADVSDIVKAPDEIKEYRTLILDTGGRMLDVMAATLIDQKGAARSGGVLTQNGYGLLKSMFDNFMARLIGLGKDVIIIAHDKEVKEEDNTVVVPDIVGGSYQIIKRSMDMIGFLNVVNDKRTLNFNSTERTVGKNCTNLPLLSVPSVLQAEFDNYFSLLIADIKRQINQKSEDGMDIFSWKEKINSCKSVAEINALIDPIAAIENEVNKRMVKSILASRTKDLGFTFSQATGRFITA